MQDLYHHPFGLNPLTNGLTLDPDGLCFIGVRIGGTLGDIDPLNQVPFKSARSIRVPYKRSPQYYL